MNKRSPDIYLLDILDSIQLIQGYLKDVSEVEFYNNVEKQDAVLRRLEIIGEAVKQIPENIRNEYKDIQWRQISGMRDVIIHQYFGVTLEMIWIVANEDIVILKNQIVEILKTK